MSSIRRTTHLAISTMAISAFMGLVASAAEAKPWEGVFEGTLGKAKIIVELNAGMEASEYKGGSSEGSRYSYYPKYRDLNLVLDKEGSELAFKETTAQPYEAADLAPNDPKITGHWTLKVTDKDATGTWTSADGKKKLPLKLTRVKLLDTPPEPPPPEGQSPTYNKLSYTYNRLWFNSEKISGAEKPVQFGDVALAFEKDSAFGLEMPVFTKFPDANGMEQANALLRDYYRKSIMQNRDCLNGVPAEQQTGKYEPEYAFEVSYASPTVVTIVDSGSVYCGGAHPDNYYNPLTFDLVNGQQIGGIYGKDLSPDGFGTVLKLNGKDERIAFETFALDRWQKAAKAAGESDGEDGCAGPGFMAEQAPGEKEFGLSFTAKGLGVQRTDYPTAAANCLFGDFNPAIIPWADLKPWLKPGQTLLNAEVR